MADETRLPIGLLGATSFVGSSLMLVLAQQGNPVLAISRQSSPGSSHLAIWGTPVDISAKGYRIEQWVSVAPIWITESCLSSLEKTNICCLIALSSTSATSKKTTRSESDRMLALKIEKAENAVRRWAKQNEIRLTILRPTLIYGHGKDKNLSEIARLIQRLRVFPLLGAANGKRQPVHVDDVAQACLNVLNHPALPQTVYVISGAEVIPYQEMVRRIFLALSLKPMFIPIPAWLFEWTVRLMNLIPRYRSWSSAMVERMNMDMTFSHEDAARDFDFKPRAFHLRREDLP
jgi:nucleoside-diphosphate-sugar epimerase